MKSIKQLFAILLCFVLSAPMTQAFSMTGETQGQQSSKVSQEDITVLIQQEQVRFTSRKATAEMQLQVFDQTGQMVFDSGATAQQELVWAFRHVNGEAVKSGVYAYTLTIKEANGESARVRRGHFIVDRAGERDNQSDRLWITSRNDDNVGADLTIARNEAEIVAGATFTAERSGVKTVDGRIGEAETALKPDAKTVAALISGTKGQIAKFTSPSDVGNSVMTEANGNIGIGITAPLTKLHILGAVNDVLPPRAQASSSSSFAAGWDFYHGTVGKGYVGVPGVATSIAPGEMLVFGGSGIRTSIWAGGTRAITVNPLGFVGMGVANPNLPYRLHVADEQAATERAGAIYAVSSNNAGILGHTRNGVGVYGLVGQGFNGSAGYFEGKVGFQGDAFPTLDGYRLGTPTRRWSAVYAVNGTIQTSDARLKKGVANLHYGLNELMQLRPVSFQWKEGDDRQHLGFIAQETQQVIPEAVTQTEADSPLGMNYATLIPVVIKSIQEQQDTVTTLKTDNEVLQQRNAALQQQNAELDLRLKTLEKTVQRLAKRSKR